MEEENSHFEMEIACLEVRRREAFQTLFSWLFKFFPQLEKSLEKLKQEKQNQKMWCNNEWFFFCLLQ